MRYVLFSLLAVLLAACSLTDPQTPDTSEPARDEESATSAAEVLLVNESERSVVYDLFPANAMRPLRQSFPVDLADPPPNLLSAGASATLFSCIETNRVEGSTLHLYVVMPSTGLTSTAELKHSIELDARFLEALPDRDCQIKIENF